MSAPDIDRGSDELDAGDSASWESFAPMHVGVHILSGTPIDTRVYSDQGRATLNIEGTNSARVCLFADRDDLARLIVAATGALAELDATPVSESHAAFRRVLNALA